MVRTSELKNQESQAPKIECSYNKKKLVNALPYGFEEKH